MTPDQSADGFQLKDDRAHGKSIKETIGGSKVDAGVQSSEVFETLLLPRSVHLSGFIEESAGCTGFGSFAFFSEFCTHGSTTDIETDDGTPEWPTIIV